MSCAMKAFQFGSLKKSKKTRSSKKSRSRSVSKSVSPMFAQIRPMPFVPFNAVSKHRFGAPKKSTYFGSRKVSRKSRRGSKKMTCNSFGRRKSRRMSHRRKSRRVSRRVSKKSGFGRRRKGSRRGSRKVSRRFGSAFSPPLQQIMGNYSPSEMSTFQQYTGMGVDQTNNHLTGIPESLRSNFYSDV